METQTQPQQPEALRQPQPVQQEVDPNENIWSVIDKNGTEYERQHTIGEGVDQKTYFLDAFKATPVPERHAVFFLKDPSFMVYDHHNELVQPNKPKSKVVNINLPPNQTIADYTELTIDSLVKRARQTPQGRKATKALGKKALRDICMAHDIEVRPNAPASAVDPAEELEAADGELPPEGADVEDDDEGEGFAAGILPPTA